MAAKQRKSIILRFAVFAFIVYIAVSLITLEFQISKTRAALASTNAQLQQQENKNAENQRILAEDDGKYKESIARDKLGYAKPNDHIYINASGN